MEENNTSEAVIPQIPEPAQPVNQAPVKPVKSNNFLVLLLSVLLLIAVSIAGLFYCQIQKLSKELARLQVQVQPTPTPIAENEVLGIQTNTCCSCPTKVPRSLIGIDGWVIYERGKNYSEYLPEECDRVDCQPCPPLEEEPSKVKECYEEISCEGPMDCMANPAAVFCTCMGGEVETRENEQGQYGVCKIDGKEYDEWEYFKKMNPEDKTFTQ